jgi:hypothetical protein
VAEPGRIYSQDLDGVYYALQDLAGLGGLGGGSLTAIAAHLYAKGVRGQRKTCFSCPIANWLRLEFGTDCDPEVEAGSVKVHLFGEDWIAPPEEINDLIDAIDDGGYSDLIEVTSHA